MNVEQLINKMLEIGDSLSSIGKTVFDELPAINTDRQKSYPVLLIKTPQSVITPFSKMDNEGLYENYNITFYVLTTWTAEDKKTVELQQRYKEVDVIASTFLRTFLQDTDNEYNLINDKSVTKTRGHHQHVDQLVGVAYNFNLRVHNCL